MNKNILMTERNSGVSWFYWITGLSIINTVATLFGVPYGFIVWLWMTQFLDGVVLLFKDDGYFISMGIFLFLSFMVSWFFALSGYLSMKGRKGWYLIATILYVLDVMLYVYAEDYISAGFHIFALVYIFRGYLAHRNLLRWKILDALIISNQSGPESEN